MTFALMVKVLFTVFVLIAIVLISFTFGFYAGKQEGQRIGKLSKD